MSSRAWLAVKNRAGCTADHRSDTYGGIAMTTAMLPEEPANEPWVQTARSTIKSYGLH